jgi:hypothetical protein
MIRRNELETSMNSSEVRLRDIAQTNTELLYSPVLHRPKLDVGAVLYCVVNYCGAHDEREREEAGGKKREYYESEAATVAANLTKLYNK